MKRHVVVTGATGFIGRHLIQRIVELGHHAIGLSRSGEKTAVLETSRAWSLGEALPVDLAADTAIHLAHDFEGIKGAERTVSGTLRLARELKSAGVTRQIFISSYSAGSHASSLYGRTKAELERRLTEIPGTVIVRPGLVLGNGGIFGRIAAFSRISPLVPLPDGGHGRVPVIEINRLCDEIIRLVDHPSPPAENNIFHRHLPTLRDLVLKVAAESGRRPIILNIPVALALPFMRGMERMGLSLPVSADSLEGFVRNQSATHVTTLEV